MVETQAGILAREDILAFMARPPGEGLFVSPILEEAQIGATSIDLRLGTMLLLSDTSTLGTLDVFGEEAESEIALRHHYRKVKVKYGERFVLHPGQTIQASTLEYIGMPSDLSGHVAGRSSILRLPLLVNTGAIHPSFRGVITLTLTSMAAGPIRLSPGMRIAQIEFRRLTRPVVFTSKSRYDLAVEPAPSQLDRDPDLKYLGPMSEPITIGLASTLGAGRTTAIAYLVGRRGFRPFSLADPIKAHAIERAIPVVRPELQKLGNQLRDSYGPAYLAQYLRGNPVWKNSKLPYVVVDGFKHPAEVEEFKKQRRFYLLGIDAPEDVRWDRISNLRRYGDPLTREEFDKMDALDRGLGYLPSYSLRVEEVMKSCDFNITNDRSKDEFYARLEEVVQRVLYGQGTPGQGEHR